MKRVILLFVSLATTLLSSCDDDDRAKRLAAAGRDPGLTVLLRVASADAGRRTFGQCAACHTIGKGGQPLAGPNLYGIMDRGVATDPRYGYTQALRTFGGRWTVQRMDAWLRAPASLVPGTKMAYAGLADPLARADLITYLQRQAD